MKFYTAVFNRGDYIYLRGYNDGVRVNKKLKYTPYLFIPSQNNTSKYSNIYGNPVEKMEFSSISDARKFLDRYKDVENFTIYGFEKFIYPFMNDFYPGKLEYDHDSVNVGVLDIEVDSENGYPDITTANKQITAITLKCKDKIRIFGYGDYKVTNNNVNYTKCSDEEELLLRFLLAWEEFDLDVITGWNIKFFDIPYLVNRITLVLGTDHSKRLSPWKLLSETTIAVFNKDNTVYFPMGIAILDYLDLYKKFTYVKQESYKLDYICHVELNEKKLDYSEYETLDRLYKENHQKFIDYNLRDVLLIDKLEDKLGLIRLALIMAYMAKVNYEDVLGSVRIWDAIIHNFLMDRNIVIDPYKESIKLESYKGAFVKEPQVGLHKWLVTFDVTSLYPSLIVQHNLSPETFYKKIMPYDYNNLLNKDIKSFPDYSLAANGTLWSTKNKGYFPQIVEFMIESRTLYKKLKLKAEQENDEKHISFYDNMQKAFKICLNSLYGAIGNRFCRWYNLNFAEAITLSGQTAIQYIEIIFNKYLNQICKTKDVDYVVAMDTDSIIVTLDKICDRFGKNKSTDEIVDNIDKLSKEYLQPKIDKIILEYSNLTNSFEPFISMKREAIANRGIWTAKKRYILNVLDSEGVRYKEPKLKIMGLEAVKSSTPQVCREKIKDCIKIIMNDTNDDLIKYIDKFRSEYQTMRFEDIASPRGCNNISEYKDASTIYKKGTPIHVKGAILYNNALKEKRLTSKYSMIYDGDKVKYCYLKTPNPIKNSVISVPSILPKEFMLEDYIDRELQFDKTFLSPIKIITNIIDWKVEHINTLEGFL